jgi:hypothetical protein
VRAQADRLRRPDSAPVAFLVAALAALAGCTTAPDPVRFPELTYAHLGAIRLAVGRIEIVDAYRPPMAAPNIEHRMPAAPAATLRRWAQDRLAAAAPGSAGRARFVIRDAHVTETELPRTQGVRGLFTTDQGQRYDLRVAIALEILDARGTVAAGAAAVATRSRTIAEDATLDARERLWFAMVEEATAAVTAELERRMRENMGRYLR